MSRQEDGQVTPAKPEEQDSPAFVREPGVRSSPRARDPRRSGTRQRAAFSAALDSEPGIVVFGDMVDSRRGREASGPWMRHLVALLNEVYGDERLSPFAFTQGDEVQGLLRPSADPFQGILYASLDPNMRKMRWLIACGRVLSGEGPATERNGDAFIVARAALADLVRRREGLRAVTGDTRADRLLAGLAPLLAELLDELTPRQREVARLALIEGCRQAEIAARLGVSAATVSVIAGRGKVRSIAALVAVHRALLAEGAAARTR